MTVAQKFLLAAAGTMLTVGLVHMGFSMFNRGKELSAFVTDEQDRGLTDAKEYGLLKYDGYTINGSVAINYAKTAVTDYGVTVYIKKGSGGTATVGTIQYTSDFAAMRDVTKPDTYINPLKEYSCTVYRDANDSFSHVEFVEQ